MKWPVVFIYDKSMAALIISAKHVTGKVFSRNIHNNNKPTHVQGTSNWLQLFNSLTGIILCYS